LIPASVCKSYGPLLPFPGGPLRYLALELSQKSGKIEGALTPENKASLFNLKSYYSNLIKSQRMPLRLDVVQGSLGVAPSLPVF